jgi:hypothetical protein
MCADSGDACRVETGDAQSGAEGGFAITVTYWIAVAVFV